MTFSTKMTSSPTKMTVISDQDDMSSPTKMTFSGADRPIKKTKIMNYRLLKSVHHNDPNHPAKCGGLGFHSLKVSFQLVNGVSLIFNPVDFARRGLNPVTFRGTPPPRGRDGLTQVEDQIKNRLRRRAGYQPILYRSCTTVYYSVLRAVKILIYLPERCSPRSCRKRMEFR